jgi:predicted DNA-binding transcriptional regulator AlpA
MHAEEYYAVEVELPGRERVMVMVALSSEPSGKPLVRVLGPGGRLLKSRQPFRADMMHWLAINLPDHEDLLLTRAAVARKTGLSIARLKELERDDSTYPKKRVFRGTRRVGFWLSEVNAWLAMQLEPGPQARPQRQSRKRAQASTI